MLFRGKEITIPQFLEEKEIRNFLFEKLINEVPSVLTLHGDVTVMQEPIAENYIRNVMETGYVIIDGNSNNLVKIASTSKIVTCIGISLYNPSNNRVIVAHINGDSISDKFYFEILKLFDHLEDLCIIKGSSVSYQSTQLPKRVELRLFGGKADWSESHIQSLCDIFYQISKKNNIIIDIRSADILSSLENYSKNKQENTEKKEASIGFAINTSGKILLFSATKHFDIKNNSYGLFSSPYDQPTIYYNFRQSFRISSLFLNLEYDSRVNNWDEIYLEKLEQKCRNEIIEPIISLLRKKFNLAVNLPNCDKELYQFIDSKLDQWRKEHGSADIPFVKILLKQIAILQYRSNPILKQLANPFTKTENDREFIKWVSEKKEIQDWCLNNLHLLIYNLIIPNNNFSELLDYLKNFPAKFHLQDAYVGYQSLKYSLENENKIFEKQNNFDKNLLSKLEKNPENYKTIITDWTREMENEIISTVLINEIKNQINKKFNKILDNKQFSAILTKLLNLLSLHQGKFLVHLHPQSPNSYYLNKMLENLANLIALKINYRHSLGSEFNKDFYTKFETILDNWLQAIKVKPLDTNQLPSINIDYTKI